MLGGKNTKPMPDGRLDVFGMPESSGPGSFLLHITSLRGFIAYTYRLIVPWTA
jgi:hypothetical protein